MEIRNNDVTNFTTDFSYTPTKMLFKDALIQTDKSNIKTDIGFNYKRKDLARFSDKVVIKAIIQESQISALDIRNFYKEVSSTDIINSTGDRKRVA